MAGGGFAFGRRTHQDFHCEGEGKDGCGAGGHIWMWWQMTGVIPFGDFHLLWMPSTDTMEQVRG